MNQVIRKSRNMSTPQRKQMSNRCTSTDCAKTLVAISVIDLLQHKDLVWRVLSAANFLTSIPNIFVQFN